MPGNREQTIIHIVSATTESDEVNVSTNALYEFKSVTLDGIDLLITLTDDNEVSDWTHSTPGSKLSIQSLRERVSEDPAIPKWALTTEFNPPVRAAARFIVLEWRAFYPSVAL